MLGKNAASKPTAGRYEQTRYTKLMLVKSASQPRPAAPSPAIPKAKPKQRPEIIPTLPGTSSCAYTTITENAEARIRPITTLRISVQNKFAYGKSKVNGRTPRIEHQITLLRPMRSPTG